MALSSYMRDLAPLSDIPHTDGARTTADRIGPDLTLMGT
jgi:hypothetical protein